MDDSCINTPGLALEEKSPGILFVRDKTPWDRFGYFPLQRLTFLCHDLVHYCIVLQVPDVSIPYWDKTSDDSRQQGLPRTLTDETVILDEEVKPSSVTISRVSTSHPLLKKCSLELLHLRVQQGYRPVHSLFALAARLPRHVSDVFPVVAWESLPAEA